MSAKDCNKIFTHPPPTPPPPQKTYPTFNSFNNLKHPIVDTTNVKLVWKKAVFRKHDM